MATGNLKKQNKAPLNNDFDSIVLQTVDEVLLSLLGESARKAVYFHLKEYFGINKEEIPHHLKEFSYALEKIFGSGAMLIEMAFMKQLHKKIKGTQQWTEPDWIVPDLTFQVYVSLKKEIL